MGQKVVDKPLPSNSTNSDKNIIRSYIDILNPETIFFRMVIPGKILGFPTFKFFHL